jgi:hypothetical protein
MEEKLDKYMGKNGFVPGKSIQAKNKVRCFKVRLTEHEADQELIEVRKIGPSFKDIEKEYLKEEVFSQRV